MPKKHHKKRYGMGKKRTVSLIDKYMKSHTILNREIFANTSQIPKMVGVNPLSTSIASGVGGLGYPLTSLIQAAGADQTRINNKVKFERLQGTVNIWIDTASAFGTNTVRATIFKVRKLAGTVGAHVSPYYSDCIECSNPMTALDVYAMDPVYTNYKGRDKNIVRVWDKTVDLMGPGTAGIRGASRKKKLRNCNSPPDYVGGASSVHLEFDFKPNCTSSYDDTGNNITSMSENHYFLLVTCQDDFANNRANIEVRYQSWYQMV